MYRVVVCSVLLIQCVSSLAVREEEKVDLRKYFVHPRDRNASSSTRIIGGEEVEPNSYPFQVALSIIKGTYSYFCGGTLISNNLVLTAAHCVDMDPETIYVGLGKHNIGQSNELNSVTLQTSSYVYHKGWDEDTLINDIALVRLPQNVTYTDYIQPVQLATGSSKYGGEKATLIGWGQTETSVSTSSVLRSVNATILTNSDCANADVAYQQVLKSTHICSSGAGYVGVCSGDSGGPLIVNGVQVGITSFGVDPCTLGYPSVFTRITEFEDWIARGGANTISGHLGAIALVALCFSYIFN